MFMIIILTILCAYIGFINHGNGADKTDKKPHMIVIMADDLVCKKKIYFAIYRTFVKHLHSPCGHVIVNSLKVN